MNNSVPYVPCACGLHKKSPNARECRWCAAKRKNIGPRKCCINFAANATADLAEAFAFALGLGQVDWDQNMLLEQCKAYRQQSDNDAAVITMLRKKLEKYETPIPPTK